eukprot:CAMPEP_0204828382 /NCGR_PEP_ID=MMETSP1346-20131115/6120_1 /ASSEMBLY_ACC=CAM_ASM_000771 /TAXON_ID=215587 /ORGANISM="Aplanochytrium stocchinoi, Strain GSBS06" /LENGTH=238 /DNA_ID=CAMNT_0051957403 /DNA_START=145 /DNA_END=858 /DNA_ORIENTATION=-
MVLPPPFPFCEHWSAVASSHGIYAESRWLVTKFHPKVAFTSSRGLELNSASSIQQTPSDTVQTRDIRDENNCIDYGTTSPVGFNEERREAIRQQWSVDPEYVAGLAMDENFGFGVYEDDDGNGYEIELTDEWRKRVEVLRLKRLSRKGNNVQNEQQRSRKSRRQRRADAYLVAKQKQSTENQDGIVLENTESVRSFRELKEIHRKKYGEDASKRILREEAWLNARFDKASDQTSPIPW